jgi:hypothetical protein
MLGRWAKKEGINIENYKQKTFEDENYLRLYYEQKILKLNALEKKKEQQKQKQKIVDFEK